MAVDRLNVTCSRGSIRRESRVGIWHQEDRREQRAPSEVLRQQGGGDPALAQGAGSGREGRCGRAGGRVPGDRRFLSFLLTNAYMTSGLKVTKRSSSVLWPQTRTGWETQARVCAHSHPVTHSHSHPQPHTPPLTHSHTHRHTHMLTARGLF